MFILLTGSGYCADRYWVNGTGNWSDTSHWSIISGGSGGASVPTINDDVYFNLLSGGGTCTINVSAECKSLTMTGYTGTVGGSQPLTIAGSWTQAGTWTHTGTVTLTGTGTLTQEASSLNCDITINVVGGTVTLGSNLTQTISKVFRLQNGTFSTSTNNYSVTAGSFSAPGSGTRILDPNGSHLTFYGFSTNSPPLTINPNTSTIEIVGSASLSSPSNLYNVILKPNSSFSEYGNFTCNNLTISPADSYNSSYFFISGNYTFTVNNSLTITGNSETRRLSIYAPLYSNRATITCNGTVSITDTNFEWINFSGNGFSESNITSTRVGGGNLTGCRLNGNELSEPNTIFDPPVTVTWTGASSNEFNNPSNWTDNKLPLPQDTAIFSGGIGNITITYMSSLPSIDTSSVTGTSNWVFSDTPFTYLFGNLYNFSKITSISNSTALSFRCHQGECNFYPPSMINCGISVDTRDCIFNLKDNIVSSISGGAVYCYYGTFNTNNYQITAPSGSFYVQGNFYTVNLGSSNILLGGSGTAFNIRDSGNFNAGTSTVILTNNGTVTVGTYTPKIYNIIKYTGNGTLTLDYDNTYNSIILDSNSNQTLQMRSGKTTTFTGEGIIARGTGKKTVRSTTSGISTTLSKTGGILVIDLNGGDAYDLSKIGSSTGVFIRWGNVIRCSNIWNRWNPGVLFQPSPLFLQ